MAEHRSAFKSTATLAAQMQDAMTSRATIDVKATNAATDFHDGRSRLATTDLELVTGRPNCHGAPPSRRRSERIRHVLGEATLLTCNASVHIQLQRADAGDRGAHRFQGGTPYALVAPAA